MNQRDELSAPRPLVAACSCVPVRPGSRGLQWMRASRRTWLAQGSAKPSGWPVPLPAFGGRCDTTKPPARSESASRRRHRCRTRSETRARSPPSRIRRSSGPHSGPVRRHRCEKGPKACELHWQGAPLPQHSV
eukprot:6595884-Prymnesium_polylepis.2